MISRPSPLGWLGSSPLARGTLRFASFLPARTRFIPAGAGNTHRQRPAGSADPVHPRWRGEHLNIGAYTYRVSGSSPLARGTHVVAWRDLEGVRFIPAGAGNTSWPGCATAWLAVHPRWRGEHDPAAREHAPGCGSSPLARGTRARRKFSATRKRFIPAGAGNTQQLLTTARFPPVHPRWRGEHTFLSIHSYPAIGSSPLARGTL